MVACIADEAAVDWLNSLDTQCIYFHLLFNGPRVEFYLYPTVGTVLIHSVKPELTE